MNGQENFAEATVVENDQPMGSDVAAEPVKKKKRIKWGRIGVWFLKILYFLRSIPVVIVIALAASALATANMVQLPEVMFIGTFELTRRMAVLAPATATALCLGMVLLSRRPVYPIVISLLTLTVPYFIRYIAPYLV